MYVVCSKFTRRITTKRYGDEGNKGFREETVSVFGYRVWECALTIAHIYRCVGRRGRRLVSGVAVEPKAKKVWGVKSSLLYL